MASNNNPFQWIIDLIHKINPIEANQHDIQWIYSVPDAVMSYIYMSGLGGCHHCVAVGYALLALWKRASDAIPEAETSSLVGSVCRATASASHILDVALVPLRNRAADLRSSTNNMSPPRSGRFDDFAPALDRDRQRDRSPPPPPLPQPTRRGPPPKIITDTRGAPRGGGYQQPGRYRQKSTYQRHPSGPTDSSQKYAVAQPQPNGHSVTSAIITPTVSAPSTPAASSTSDVISRLLNGADDQSDGYDDDNEVGQLPTSGLAAR